MSSPAPLTPDRWSLESWFSGFGKADYIDFKAVLVRDIEAIDARDEDGDDGAEVDDGEFDASAV